MINNIVKNLIRREGQLIIGTSFYLLVVATLSQTHYLEAYFESYSAAIIGASFLVLMLQIVVVNKLCNVKNLHAPHLSPEFVKVLSENSDGPNCKPLQGEWISNGINIIKVSVEDYPDSLWVWLWAEGWRNVGEHPKKNGAKDIYNGDGFALLTEFNDTGRWAQALHNIAVVDNKAVSK